MTDHRVPTDEQDRAEALDDDAEPMVAPDHLVGAQAYGAAGAEPHATEPVARRAAREEPELGLAEIGDEARGVQRTDDPTLHDVATERAAPPPAEEAAMHVVDDAPSAGGFVSAEVDPDLDPDLEVALIDPGGSPVPDDERTVEPGIEDGDRDLLPTDDVPVVPDAEDDPRAPDDPA
jgi:hypothetical protein